MNIDKIKQRLLDEIDREYMESLRHRYPDATDIQEVHAAEMRRYAQGKLTWGERLRILFGRPLAFERYFAEREAISWYGESQIADVSAYKGNLSPDEIRRMLKGDE